MLLNLNQPTLSKIKKVILLNKSRVMSNNNYAAVGQPFVLGSFGGFGPLLARRRRNFCGLWILG